MRTFWKLIIYAKLPSELKAKTAMRKAQGTNFKELSLACYGHLVLLHWKLYLYILLIN